MRGTAVCLEPDVRSFRKLSAYAQALAAEGRAVYPLQAAAWSEDATLTFHDTGNRNASLLPTPQSRERLRQVAAAAPDSAWECASAGLPVGGYRRLDFIKYDVEGAERDALLGSRSLIRQDSPRLLVSVYHRSADLWELPLLVRSLYPGASLYLRRMDGVPAWDIELYAVPDEELPAVARELAIRAPVGVRLFSALKNLPVSLLPDRQSAAASRGRRLFRIPPRLRPAGGGRSARR